MQHPFEVLRSEYEALLARMVVTKPAEVDRTAKRLLSYRSRYAAVSQRTGGPPVIVLATLHERESGANFRTNLAQGDPLTRPSTHVPAGRPKLAPGMSFPVTWEYAAEDAIRYDRLNDNSHEWSWAYACWKGEAWNGFGPRNHGIHTGYLWAGTNIYDRGKYVADGKWNAAFRDPQLGIVPVMRRMVELAPDLDLSAWHAGAPFTPSLIPLKVPVGVGGGAHDTYWLQAALNVFGTVPPLRLDGSFGRRTRAAVRDYQTAYHLKVDGLAGDVETIPSMEARLTAAQRSEVEAAAAAARVLH